MYDSQMMYYTHVYIVDIKLLLCLSYCIFPSLMVKDLAFVGAASLTCRKSAVAVELYCVLSCFVVNYAFVVFSVLCLLASDL